ncbi:MAG: hypothetical protein AAF911_09595 [Planctomycetota bacterium]
MKTHLPRVLTALTVLLLMGSFANLSWAQRGPDREGAGGFGPEDGDGPMLIEDSDRDRDRGRDDRRVGGRMSDEEVDAAYRIVVQLYPDLAERLDALRDEDPRRFKQTLERRFPRVRFLVQLQQRDPEMFDLRMADISLDQQTDALAKQLRDARAADDEDRYDELRDQIEAKVTEHFDVRQQIRAREIEMLKARLEELEQDLDDRDDDRKDLIEVRVNELAGSDW